ncbi:MAG TPA: hypothetical protein VI387_08755, partial [Candidatus Brocadiales bacterium]|nr:hypothetical protein [Candidatus Brocadiales bacterium]
MKINQRHYLAGILFLTVVLSFYSVTLSLPFVSANNTISLTSNVSNSTWLKGGTNLLFNFTIVLQGINDTTNITQVNISSANITLNSSGLKIANITGAGDLVGWTCAAFNSSFINCT